MHVFFPKAKWFSTLAGNTKIANVVCRLSKWKLFLSGIYFFKLKTPPHFQWISGGGVASELPSVCVCVCVGIVIVFFWFSVDLEQHSLQPCWQESRNSLFYCVLAAEVWSHYKAGHQRKLLLSILLHSSQTHQEPGEILHLQGVMLHLICMYHAHTATWIINCCRLW